jgi:hypothetical protein
MSPPCVPRVENKAITLSNFINKFSIELLCKKENKMANPWYHKECNIAIKYIENASNDSLKYDEIN